jgi:tetratricopeptide (TPR) repeat protein
VLFRPDGKGLITYGVFGLFEWPIHPGTGSASGAWEVGPPRLLWDRHFEYVSRAAWLPGRLALALTDSAQIVVQDLGAAAPELRRPWALWRGPNRSISSLAVSPDGRWVVTGDVQEHGPWAWDLRRRVALAVLPGGDRAGVSQSMVNFSPDGRWLVSCSASPEAPGYYFWKVGTWERGFVLEYEGSGGWGAPVFSRDGRLMALSISAEQVLLADPKDGRPLARLSTLQPLNATPLAFSPDGTRLAVATNKTVLLWDLRAVRARLAELGLNWDRPPYGPPAPSTTLAPATVRVRGWVTSPRQRREAELLWLNLRLIWDDRDGDAHWRRGCLYWTEDRRPEALADFKAAVRLRPDHPEAHHWLAEAYRRSGDRRAALAELDRHLALAPRDVAARLARGQLALELGQPQRAADDFTRALQAEPERHTARYSRAWAYLRLRRYREALVDIEWLLGYFPRSAQYTLMRSTAYEGLGDRRARAERQKARALLPSDPVALEAQAWRAAVGPAAGRDEELAQLRAEKAVDLAPKETEYRITLGAALYRLGRHAQARAALEKGLESGKGRRMAAGLLFLAMCLKRLGEEAAARACFERAVAEAAAGSRPAHWQALRAEAEALLGPGPRK